jgi:hypothetical protein
MNDLEIAALTYVEQPETPKTGECQKVDGYGWEDTRREAFHSTQLYVKQASNTSTTPYAPCD